MWSNGWTCGECFENQRKEQIRGWVVDGDFARVWQEIDRLSRLVNDLGEKLAQKAYEAQELRERFIEMTNAEMVHEQEAR